MIAFDICPAGDLGILKKVAWQTKGDFVMT
jgi:hypothetical protein